jgi:nucleoside-triphosphatase THEP1
MSIIIFSKPIHSGKTTALMQFCASQQNIGGILMPDVEGKRKMLDIRSNEYFEAECKDPVGKEWQLTSIGRYHFYSSAFEKANSILLKEMELSPQWLIIDEMGKLEMDGRGFYPALKELLPLYNTTKDTASLLLVARDTLVDTVISFFEIKDPLVISTLP